PRVPRGGRYGYRRRYRKRLPMDGSDMKERNWLELVRPRTIDAETAGTSTTIALEPLERGFGFTLGNALRRTRLSSIPGPAITAIRLRNGASGPTVVGRDDSFWLDLMLNLKQLAFRAETDFEGGRASAALSGGAPLTAAA